MKVIRFVIKRLKGGAWGDTADVVVSHQLKLF